MLALSLIANTHQWKHTRVQKRGRAGALSHAETHTTQHTNTRNRMPVRVLVKRYARRTHANARKCLRTCDRTSITSAMHRQTRSLCAPPGGAHPHAPSSAQPRTRRERPRMHSPAAAAQAAARASAERPARTHTRTRSQHKPARRERFILQLGVRGEWAPSRTLRRLGSRDRHTPHPTRAPLCPQPICTSHLKAKRASVSVAWSRRPGGVCVPGRGSLPLPLSLPLASFHELYFSFLSENN